MKRNLNIQCTRLKDCHDEKWVQNCLHIELLNYVYKWKYKWKLCKGLMFEANWSIAGYTKSLIPSFIYIYLIHTRPGFLLLKLVSNSRNTRILHVLFLLTLFEENLFTIEINFEIYITKNSFITFIVTKYVRNTFDKTLILRSLLIIV